MLRFLRGAIASERVNKNENEKYYWKMFNKILVPVDSITFDNTLLAVEESLEFANACSVEGAPELIFLHVWNIETSRISQSEEERLRKLREDEMEEEFEEIENMCQEKGLNNFRTVFKKGKAAHEEIVMTAKEEDVDMIIMGSGKLHNRSRKGRIEKFIYGSITEKVIHETPCSVMVVRPREKSNPPEAE